ncbi:MAG: efflux RND transporter periplasmic adaptor subunit [Thiohalomonadaceae bacterium]
MRAFFHSCLALVLLALAACGQQPPAAQDLPQRLHLVETAAAVQGSHGAALERIGTLRALREIRVLMREEGRLLELPYHEGDRVAKGALLARLDDALLAAELRKAEAQLRQDEDNLKRIERLQAKGLVSEDELSRARAGAEIAKAEAELLRVRLGFTRVTAPFAGVISARLAEPGDVVQRFGHVLTLTDPDSLVTEVPVSELLLPDLKVGDPVEMRIDALGPRPLEGKVLRIHPNVDPATRQGTVEVALDPAPPGAGPGQLARLRIHARRAERLTVPFAALQRDGQGEFVFRVEDHVARRTPVVSGLQLGDAVEIVSGLSQGDRVVVRGFLNLTDGKGVKVVDTP